MEWHPLSLLGLALIACGWFLQFRRVTPKNHEMIIALPLLNAAGAILLVVDSLFGGQIDIAVFNVITLAGALLVLLAMGWKTEAKKANAKIANAKKRKKK